MIPLLNKLLNRNYSPLNLVEISKSALINNYNILSSLYPNFEIAPVLKSNAYGHGLISVAKILDSQNPPFFCVDSLYEAYLLKNAGIKSPILIMGYVDPENLKIKQLPFSYAVFDLETAKLINKYQKNAKVHIKVDTGMHRLGVQINEFNSFVKELQKLPHLKIEGLMSHLASAEGKSDQLFKNQINNFKQAISVLNSAGINPKWIHLAASSAITNQEVNQEIFQISNVGRAGIALYGITSDPSLNLQPALTLITKIVHIKTIHKGERVGYDGTFKTNKDLVIGVLPIGYNDGVDRGLSNNGIVLIDKKMCPIIGRISMNMTTIDLSAIDNPIIGQEVTVFSNHQQDWNSVISSAKLSGKIPYELLVHLNSSTKRVIVN